MANFTSYCNEDESMQCNSELKFERQITKLISDHGISMFDAMRWLAQAENIDLADGDVGEAQYFFWSQGLSEPAIETYTALVGNNVTGTAQSHHARK